MYIFKCALQFIYEFIFHLSFCSQLSESDYDKRLLISVCRLGDENELRHVEVLGCMSFGLQHLAKKVRIVIYNNQIKWIPPQDAKYYLAQII